jgi:hypothetical protein
MHDIISAASFISLFKIDKMQQSWHSRSSLIFCNSFHNKAKCHQENIIQVLLSRAGSWPYPQMLDQAVKTFQG